MTIATILTQILSRTTDLLPGVKEVSIKIINLIQYILYINELLY